MANSRKRLLEAIACPSALVILSVCHSVVAGTYCVTLAVTREMVYLPLAVSYAIVSLIGWWKVSEMYSRKREKSPPDSSR